MRQLTGRVALILILSFKSLHAGTFTAEELLKQCSAKAGSPQRKQCESYVAGVTDGIDTLITSMKLLDPESPGYPQLFCLAPGKRIGDLVEATARYINRNRSGRHYNAASEVLLALQEAFPCKDGGT